MSDSDALKAATDRILAALRARSWQRFRAECCPHIAIEEYWRLWPDGIPPKRWDELSKSTLFPEGVIFSDDKGKEPGSLMSVLGIRVDMQKPPSKETLRAFRKFGGYVADSLEWKYSWRVEAETAGGQYEPLCGTAITGKIASNMGWWIGLENHGGQWKVRRLVLEGR